MKNLSYFKKYMVFDKKELNITSKVKNNIIPVSKIDNFKEDIFSFLSSKTVTDIYFDQFASDQTEISFLICKFKNKIEFEKIKDKILSYYGIYLKTKHISSIYFFDKKEFVFVELSAGSLEGDELITVIANQMLNKLKKLKLERHDFLCDVDYDSEEEDYNELID